MKKLIKIGISLAIILTTNIAVISNAFAVDSLGDTNIAITNDSQAEGDSQIAEGDSAEPFDEDTGLYNN